MTSRPSVTPARRRDRGGLRRPQLARRVAGLTLLALSAAIGGPATAGAAQQAASGAPLPASNYSVRRLCPPPAPGYVSCLALRLVPVSAAARAHTHPIGITKRHAIRAGLAAEGAYGLRPHDLQAGYSLPTEAPIPQTVGIVDAYDDPTIEADLNTYDQEFGLPACTKANGCFRKVNQAGNEGAPPLTEGGWAGEISLDVEITHAVCRNCHILLVEASSESSTNLEAAEDTAVALGATEVTNSWGGPETAIDSAAFSHTGTVITAASGDYGYLNWDSRFAELVGHPDYPASSPHVVSVGGTRLKLGLESQWESERVWNDGSTAGENLGAGGGGCSEHFTAPAWQQAVAGWSEVGCETRRAVADVAADADPLSGVAVYDSTPEEPGLEAPGWQPIGGTSLASPIVASVFALAGGSGGVSYPAQTLYSHLGAASLHDVVVGSNGRCTKPFEGGGAACTAAEEAAQCSAKRICLTAAGYDGPSGIGTPHGVEAFKPPPPTVSGVEPSSGNIGGNRPVKIAGTNLVGTSSVSFGGAAAAEVKVVSASEITVKSPEHAAGTVDVTVTTPGGTSATSVADKYTFVTPLPPTVASVSPSEGSTIGGRTVKITGTNLEDGTAVKFGAASGTEIHEVSASEITVKSPEHAAGTVDVTVTTPGGTTATSVADSYTFVMPPPPTVTGVSPAQGSTAGGTTVRVTGTSLEGASAVHFGTAAASEVKVLSETEVTVKSPAHASATVDVTLTTPSGTSAISGADSFSFQTPPPEAPGGSEVPGAGSAGNLAGSPFAGSAPYGSGVLSDAFSNFNLLGQQFDRKSGVVKLTVAVFHKGTLHWVLTFRGGAAAHCSQHQGSARASCRPGNAVFGEGTRAIDGARIVTIAVTPGPAAKRVLRHGAGLAVKASLSYTADGGGPIAHSASLSVRLKKHARGRGRRH